MIRWIPPVLCSLAIVFTAPFAHARADHQEAPLLRASPTTVAQINWGGGVVSRGNIRVSGLPSIRSAREATRSAPGERINRPTFGAGTRGLSSEPNSGAASGLPTGKRRHKPIRIRKRVDRDSPMLRRAHATRRPLPGIVITGRGPSGAKVKWVIEKPHVTAYSVSGSGNIAVEELTIVFEDIRQTPS